MNNSTYSQRQEGEFTVIVSKFQCGCVLEHFYKNDRFGTLVKTEAPSICSDRHRKIIIPSPPEAT